MFLSIRISNQNYKIDDENALDISIPLNFNGAQPAAYGAEKATSKPCETGNLIGDTRRGGSCNFEEYKFIPHCNGTHTESVGHITHERISVHRCLRDVFIRAELVSIEPESAAETQETYAIELSKDDKLITRDALRSALRQAETGASTSVNLEPKTQSPPERELSRFDESALIIRTLPNDESKLTRSYSDNIPPFFSTEAMRFIRKTGVKHLLVDLPSIDRIFDEGKLSNHRAFWNIAPGAFEINEKTLIHNTITELIFVPNEITDGSYLLNLQIAAFVADASPSRPILFKLLD